MKAETLTRLNKERENKSSVVLVTRLCDGEHSFFHEDGICDGFQLDDEQKNAAYKALLTDSCQLAGNGDDELFFQPFNPPLRMLIVGAVHIARYLIPIAKLCHYHITIIDPRPAFASTDRFPDVEINTEWPDKALKSLNPDRRCAIVTLSHDPKIDDPALEFALRSCAFYIGALGSKKTQSGRLNRLVEKGYSAERQQSIHGPIGLDIAARSPAEIAISIMAEITLVLRTNTR